MCTLLPNLTCDWFEVSTAKVVIFAVEHYLLIGLYAFLLVLVVLNIWIILIRQRRYKTLPLLAFYVYSFFAILFRLIYIIFEFSTYPLIYYLNDQYLIAKLNVGLMQCWMILEIALRVRRTYKANNAGPLSIESFEKFTRYGQYSVIIISIVLVLANLIFDILNIKTRDKNDNWKFPLYAYSFLGMFFLMLSASILLHCVMKERKKEA